MFPRDIAMLIASYDEWVIAPWVTTAVPLLSTVHLAANPMAFDIIMRRREWYYEYHRWMLARNPAVPCGPLICHDELYSNPAAMDIYLNLTKRDVIPEWPPTTKHRRAFLCANPAAMDMIRILSPASLDWHYLCMNPSAMDMIRAAPPELLRYSVCANPAAMDIITAMPAAALDWYHLCMNPAAMGMIRANLDKIEPSIYMNPAIFIIDAARVAAYAA